MNYGTKVRNSKQIFVLPTSLMHREEKPFNNAELYFMRKGTGQQWGIPILVLKKGEGCNFQIISGTRESNILESI